MIQDWKAMSYQSRKTRKNLSCQSLSERSHSEQGTYCMIPTLTCWKRHKSGDSGCQGLGGRKYWKGRALKIFRLGPWNYLAWCYNGGFIIHLCKFIEFTTQGANANVNYELWMMMCQCKFIMCPSAGACWQWGGSAFVEIWVYGKTLPSSQFCYECKIDFKVYF